MGESRTIDSGIFAGGTFGVWIPIDGEVPDSLSCIPLSKAQQSGFYKNNFFGIRIPDSLT